MIDKRGPGIHFGSTSRSDTENKDIVSWVGMNKPRNKFWLESARKYKVPWYILT